MEGRPTVVAFDVIGTLFSLDGLRPPLAEAGFPPYALELWFARMIRDAMALDATGVYKPFREVATATLAGMAVGFGADAGANRIGTILDQFASLGAHPDAAPAMRVLKGGGVRIVALTNGSPSNTAALMDRAGLHDVVERIVTIDEVGHWKPHREVYLHCADSVGVEPAQLGLVAVHAWDVHGAKRAGLMTGYVARDGTPFPATMDLPDVTGGTLVEAAEQFVAAG